MKTLKVFMFGKRLKNVYPHASKWQVFKYRVARFMRKVSLFVGAIALVGLGIWAGSYFFPNTVTAINEIKIDTLPQKVEELKAGVVAELEQCESGGYPSDRGIIIFDSNDQASIGVLQMQKTHVKHFYKELYGQEITGQEAVVIAITPEKARPLAKDVLFKVEDGWKEWYNCGRKLDLATKIDYIKQLEQ